MRAQQVTCARLLAHLLDQAVERGGGARRLWQHALRVAPQLLNQLLGVEERLPY